MTIHEFDTQMRTDDCFVDGDYKYLIKGNKCRFLDGRRTTGIIEDYFEESAMFRWRITNYEDQGKFWDLPIDFIKHFQFEKDSKILDSKDVKQLILNSDKFNVPLKINFDENIASKTDSEIEQLSWDIEQWLELHSEFIQEGRKLKFQSMRGNELLWKDLQHYMNSVNLLEIEQKTAEAMVLNPNSGEWIKGMKIVLAEMGLAMFEGTITRTNSVFDGLGEKENRRRYIIHRLAFVRAYFRMKRISEVKLYRGMSTESNWRKKSRTFLHGSFNLDVGKEFSSFDFNSKFRNSYLMMITVPVEKLFMTYLETESMNSQYEEAEALILYDNELNI